MPVFLTRSATGDGCDGDTKPTVHDGSGDSHLGGSGDHGIDDRPLKPPAAWTQSPNGSESATSEPGADLEAVSVRAPTPPPFDDEEAKPKIPILAEKGQTLVRLDATCTVFSRADEETSDEPPDSDLDAFLSQFSDCPANFDTTALEHFLRVFETHAPEAAADAMHRFVETTSAESYSVAVDLWKKWKQPDLPTPGAPPANFLDVYKELFPL